MITSLVFMIFWNACAAGIRIFCWRDAAVAAAGLTRECFIIPHRSGAAIIPMRSTAQESSTELRSVPPVSTMGAHVGAVPDRSPDRVTDFHTRGVTAMAEFRLRIKPRRFYPMRKKQQIKSASKRTKKYERSLTREPTGGCQIRLQMKLRRGCDYRGTGSCTGKCGAS